MLHRCLQAKRDALGPYAFAGEVFVKSNDPLRRQPLEIQEIEFRRLAEEAGEQGVDLPTMVG